MSAGVRHSFVLSVFLVWVIGVGAGLATLWSYENEPGPSASAPARWPAATQLVRSEGRVVAVVALHPQCPCSRATVAELARLVAHAAGRIEIHALFVAPPSVDESWARTPLWDDAAAIPGVHVSRDDGTEARRFGARVSGQMLVYDGAGRLAFNGGITGSRGHEGDNAGRSAVESLIAGRPHASSTFVFGCLL